MTDVARWAEEEFGDAQLGDPRRVKRAVMLAAAAAQNPGGTVTEVVTDSAEKEGGFRFLRNQQVSAEALASSAHAASWRRGKGSPFVFVAVDQSSIGVTDRTGTKEGLGQIGGPGKVYVRGLQAMTGLGISPDGRVLGVCGQRWWSRLEQSPGRHEDKRDLEKRESSLWHQVIDDVEKLRVTGAKRQAWYQLDRAGDAWHLLKKAHEEGLLMTVRSAHDRTIGETGEEERLRGAVSKEKVSVRLSHYLRAGAAKRAGHRPDRARQLAIRSKEVLLRLTSWEPGRPQTNATYWVVHVREVRPPRGCERLEWFLLTTYPVRTASDAELVVKGYCMRWRVEEFHKTWKTGACNVENSQLRSAENFKRWATILAAVASRIERLKQVSRTTPDISARKLASQDEIDAAILLTKRCDHRPGASLTALQFVTLVANLGGYTGKSSGGPPGSIVIARGFERVLTAAAALTAAKKLGDL